MKKTKFTIGIDEVGRGPLAGPVTVGVFCIKNNYLDIFQNKIKNSKAISSKARDEKYNDFLQLKAKGVCTFHTASVSPARIDSFGISSSIKTALNNALRKLQLDPLEVEVYLDGGLKAPGDFLYQKTVIKGDEKIDVIAAASIIAKVRRDRMMVKLSLIYPEYGFDRHKGYGTKDHKKALKIHGLSPVHRSSFIH